MIPLNGAEQKNDFEIIVPVSKTYNLDFEGQSIKGYTDGELAIRQAVFKILMTERYKYEIYDGNYGIELEDLYGKNKVYVKSELARRIKDALLTDDRIYDVSNFSFSDSEKEKGALRVNFTVISAFGENKLEWEVDI